MDDRELKLNSLSRYAKTSPLFILEEHGHCEVPAGCGGVVLRWRNPRAGVPFTMWLHTGGPSRMMIDGVVPSSAKPVVGYGRHVLAFVVREVDPAYLVLSFAAVSRMDGDVRVVTGAAQAETWVRTADDGTWRYAVEEPPDEDWLSPGFDDSGWPAMVAREERPAPAEGTYDSAEYRLRQLTERGAVGLGIPGRATAAWIRRDFYVSPPADGRD